MAAIGIMGGTFNPIHNGHLAIAQAAKQQYHLEEVWFMPNHIPSYKSEAELISGSHRLAMTRLAIEGTDGFVASDFELKQEGNTYTAVTLQQLKKQYPQHSFSFILGADSLFTFEKWWHPEHILQNAVILAAPRNQTSYDTMTEQINHLEQIYGKNNFFLIHCPEISCSSSEIRQSFQQPVLPTEDDMCFCLPVNVYRYIVKHRLYQNL